MKPSDPVFALPGRDEDPTHDAISAWLLRAVKKPGLAESLLAAAHPSLKHHEHRYTGIELEVLIGDGPFGIADARLDFGGGAVQLWVEIKTDDKAIGALVRQVKMYQRKIPGGAPYWLALMPYRSQGALEFLAHAGIGVYCTPEMPQDLLSLAVRQGRADRFDAIPEGGV